MNIPSGKKAKLDRMREIVDAVSLTSRDTSLVRELIYLANHPDFEGMRKRRARLDDYLVRLSKVNQQAAIDRWWAKIHETVSEFNTEIMDASSSDSSTIGEFQ